MPSNLGRCVSTDMLIRFKKRFTVMLNTPREEDEKGVLYKAVALLNTQEHIAVVGCIEGEYCHRGSCLPEIHLVADEHGLLFLCTFTELIMSMPVKARTAIKITNRVYPGVLKGSLWNADSDNIEDYFTSVAIHAHDGKSEEQIKALEQHWADCVTRAKLIHSVK